MWPLLEDKGGGHPSQDTFSNSCSFQSPHHMPTCKVSHPLCDTILRLDTPFKMTFTFQTDRIPFRLMRDRRPCWLCWQFCTIYKEQSAMIFQLVLVRLEFCSKAARVNLWPKSRHNLIVQFNFNSFIACKKNNDRFHTPEPSCLTISLPLITLCELFWHSPRINSDWRLG